MNSEQINAIAEKWAIQVASGLGMYDPELHREKTAIVVNGTAKLIQLALSEATAELQRELDALKSKPVNLELLAAHDRWRAMAESLAFTVLMQCDEHSINCNCNLCSALARFNALKSK